MKDVLHFHDDFLWDTYLDVRDMTLYIRTASGIKPPVKIIIQEGNEENSKIEYTPYKKEN